MAKRTILATIKLQYLVIVDTNEEDWMEQSRIEVEEALRNNDPKDTEIDWTYKNVRRNKLPDDIVELDARIDD